MQARKQLCEALITSNRFSGRGDDRYVGKGVE